MTSAVKRRLSIGPVLASLKDICTPFGLEIALCAVIALLIYGAVFYKRLFIFLSSGEPLPPDYFRHLIDKIFDPINQLPFMDSLSGALLWSFVGVMLYMIAVAVINIGVGIRNISTAAETNRDAKVKIVSISYELRRSAWILLTLVYLYFFTKLARYLLLQFNADLNSKQWLGVCLGVLVMSLANYILYVLINLTRLGPPLISLKEN
jgi:hypothetical protein